MKLKLRPEIQCFPTWVARAGVYENVSPESLGVSATLAGALSDWAHRWDATYDLVNDPESPSFRSSAEERSFWEDGRKLADRLQAELAAEWTVHFEPES